ncbi:MAG: hypothetical protein DI556_20710 [Rhodovulum sulfidophilum]|uniref:Uncharacterized protein n=1 Tax=Rhodovulum sulfidophilum TaxID=35806 RepID=A0A2W5N1J9_RHOSU|nr:MAG: hypothetical protein DI556_20710 [Rhodovulum sulfidophilum]
MFNWDRFDDTEPLLLPDGRIAKIRYTFVRSAARPAFGAVGAFDPVAGSVLWSTGLRDTCQAYGAGERTLMRYCERAALMPCGRERSAARDEYLALRKYLGSEMIGRVLQVEGEVPNPEPGVSILWTLGIEETSTLEFEMALASEAQPKRR